MKPIKNNPNRQFHTTNQPIDAGQQQVQLKDPVNATQQVSSNQQAMETKAGYSHEVVKKAATQTKAPAKAAGKGSARSYRKKASAAPETKTPTKSNGVRSQYSPALRKKMGDIDAARIKDLENGPGVAWKADDLARDLILNNPEMLKQLSSADKFALLEALIDDGAGVKASVNSQDGKAIVALLDSMSPSVRSAVLEQIGGADKLLDRMAQYCYDKEIDATKKLAADTPAPIKSSADGKSTGGVTSGGSVTHTKATDNTQAAPRKNETAAPARSTAPAGGKGLSAAAQRELAAIRAQFAKESKVKGSIDHKADNMARAFIAKYKDQLANMAPGDLDALMNALLDKSRSSNENVHIHKEDGDAIIALLKALPGDKAGALLKRFGGANAIVDAMNQNVTDKNKDKYCDQSHKNALYGIEDKATEAAAKAFAAKNMEGVGNDALSVSKAHFRQVNNEINSVTAQLRGCKDKNRREELRMKLQELMQEKRQIFELITTMLKQMHDMAMSAIRKI